MLKIIISGTRHFNDYELLKETCDKMLVNHEKVIIISGKCETGADVLGERYAKERGYEIIEFPAPWRDIEDKPEEEIATRKDGEKYWKMAGLWRNAQMANIANGLICFWDGKSRGTKNMIWEAEQKGLKKKVVQYKK